MKRYILMGMAALGLSVLSQPAHAGMLPDTQADAAAIEARLAGNDGYHALLAKKLARIAVEEAGQSDMPAARAFIRLAEQHAEKAGGAK
jgi:hypothetical protein